MKVYEKPRVYIERFELSQHVADCGWELQQDNENVCYAISDPEWGFPDGLKAFMGSNTNCDTEPEGYCYTPSSGAVGLFRS